MLNLQAILTRKAEDFPVWDCVIEKIVELPEAEYKYFKTAPLRDMPFIAENTDLMYRYENGVFHCLLVLGEESSDGILIESEGYNYARYSSFMPGAHEFVNVRLTSWPTKSSVRVRKTPPTEHDQFTLMRYRSGIMFPSRLITASAPCFKKSLKQGRSWRSLSRWRTASTWFSIWIIVQISTKTRYRNPNRLQCK